VTGDADQPAELVLPDFILPAPLETVRRCSECARHLRVAAAVGSDQSALTDARVLLARHLTEDHRPEPAPGCEQ
jgi:hypothetical protein